MLMVAERSRQDLAKAARMYFLDGRSQQDVATAFGTSRSNVSRMLSAARELGIVEIHIRDDSERCDELESQFKQRFELQDCLVSAHTPGALPGHAVAALASRFLLANIRDGQSLALSWGTALQAMVRDVTPRQQHNIEVVPLVGGLSSLDAALTGQELVRELATKLGARYRYLHAPALLTNPSAVEAFTNEQSVKDALDAAASADIAFVGVGTFGDSSSAAVIEALSLSPADLTEFEVSSPAGDICARYFDIDGVPSPSAVVRDHVIAVDLEDLRRIPTVVGVTSGRVKAPGLVGALRGGYLDVLICDEAAARATLALDEAVPARS
ncbi:sugar-binding transcriptional regulator [Actinomycetes bacterium M1A6_2h]